MLAINCNFNFNLSLISISCQLSLGLQSGCATHNDVILLGELFWWSGANIFQNCNVNTWLCSTVWSININFDQHFWALSRCLVSTFISDQALQGHSCRESFLPENRKPIFESCSFLKYSKLWSFLSARTNSLNFTVFTCILANFLFYSRVKSGAR